MKKISDLIGFLEHLKSMNKTQVEIELVLKKLEEIATK